MNAPSGKGRDLNMSKHEEWDYENAEVHEPEREVKSVYSLRFTAGEIADIRAAARREGVSTSEFIRTAARTRATTQALPAALVAALGLALVDTCERYTAATDHGNESRTIEDLASWLREHSSGDEPTEQVARMARGIAG